MRPATIPRHSWDEDDAAHEWPIAPRARPNDNHECRADRRRRPRDDVRHHHVADADQGRGPDGVQPQLPPFDVDQSIPRAGITDKVLMRGLPPKDVTFVDPVFFDGQVVRINMKVKG
jgi:hypothetical protein